MRPAVLSTMIHGGDMKLNLFITFLIANLIGFLLGSFVGDYICSSQHGDTLKTVNKAIADCEASLPRNQRCYIIAVPPSKD